MATTIFPFALALCALIPTLAKASPAEPAPSPEQKSTQGADDRARTRKDFLGQSPDDELRNNQRIWNETPAVGRPHLADQIVEYGGWGNWVPEDAWSFVDDPEAVQHYITIRGEPVSAQVLDAVERLFPVTFSHIYCMKAAAILYR